MKRILGDDFRLAVLDDVLMSVDSGHRREVCRLLKMEFPNTQFVLTTHDRVWLNHMVAEGLLTKGAVREFRRWTVDDAPHAWDFVDVWTEAAPMYGPSTEVSAVIRGGPIRTATHAIALADPHWSTGLAIGLGGSLGFTRRMEALLFGISPLDPVTFTAMPIVLAPAAVLASYLPARRGGG